MHPSSPQLLLLVFVLMLSLLSLLVLMRVIIMLARAVDGACCSTRTHVLHHKKSLFCAHQAPKLRNKSAAAT